ncbi:MAG TPA: CPBP family intramembrane glutamic endopeptidase [Verrucomicrobiae bacterium]|nr:CPBP family intramembrane glutamic endopeptidase [Verrucomicrobiae bacterium]
MANSSLPRPVLESYPPAGGALHTTVVVVVIAAWAYVFKILTDRLAASSHPDRLRFYIVSLLLEWLMLGLVVIGVKHRGASMNIVFGDRWRSARAVFRDTGIALGFWVVSIFILAGVSRLLRIHSSPAEVAAMMPHGPAEIAAWLALSISAGICEEAIFRGYLQRQFIVFTRSAPAGIALSAVAFGAGHAYQGLRMVVLIAVFGALFGVLVHWRKSTRPGMIAHSWQDALSGIVAGLAKH